MNSTTNLQRSSTTTIKDQNKKTVKIVTRSPGQGEGRSDFHKRPAQLAMNATTNL